MFLTKRAFECPTLDLINRLIETENDTVLVCFTEQTTMNLFFVLIKNKEDASICLYPLFIF